MSTSPRESHRLAPPTTCCCHGDARCNDHFCARCGTDYPATPAPLDGHQTPGEFHDYRVACVKCGEPGFLHVSWRPETWTDPGSLTAALNEEARK